MPLCTFAKAEVRCTVFGMLTSLIAALLLSACAMKPEAIGNPLSTPAPSIQPTPSPHTSDAPPSFSPTPKSIEPLRLTIPTPGAEPSSGWRPPLYPVPWAVAPNDHFYFIRPIAADQIDWNIANYRYGGMVFEGVVHTGIDIPTDEGTPIHAAGSGTVIWAGWGFFSGESANNNDPYGMAVAIEHDFGYNREPLYTVYAHMSEIDVVRGQWVEIGEQLGLVGNTGHTTGPHLHFEVRWEMDDFLYTYNPELWIAPPQGFGVLAGRLMDDKGMLLRGYQLQVISFETGKMRKVSTYGPSVVNGDPYYQENLVLSDLPPGWYELRLRYHEDENSKNFQTQIQIFPGQISYFTLEGMDGFSLELPKSAGMQAWTPTPEDD